MGAGSGRCRAGRSMGDRDQTSAPTAAAMIAGRFRHPVHTDSCVGGGRFAAPVRGVFAGIVTTNPIEKQVDRSLQVVLHLARRYFNSENSKPYAEIERQAHELLPPFRNPS